MTATTTQYASPAPASSSGGSTATFRTIRRTFWTDPYIESMPPARKLLYIYLFTSPHTNNLGVLNTTTRRIAFETGMTEDEVKEHLNVLEQQDAKITIDDLGGGCSCGGGLSILVVNFIKHQCTTSPKLVMSLRALFRGVESEKIRAVLIAKNPHLLDGMDTVSGTLSIRSGEIDQDQIQENKKRSDLFLAVVVMKRGGRGEDRERGTILSHPFCRRSSSTRTPRSRTGKGTYSIRPLPPPPSPLPLRWRLTTASKTSLSTSWKPCNGTIQPSTFQRRLIGLGNGLGTIRHPRSLYATHGVSSRHG